MIYSWSNSTATCTVDGVAQDPPSAYKLMMCAVPAANLTYDLSNFSTNISGTLAPSSWITIDSNLICFMLGSSLSPGPGNICNPFSTSTSKMVKTIKLGTGTNNITGNNNDNLFVCSTGTDTIDGTSTGTNTVQFSVARSSLGLTNNSGTWTVTGQGGDKTLTNIQFLQCSDGLYPLSLSTGKNLSTGLFRYHL